MNVEKIKKLSTLCYELQAFKDRCTWASADFTVGDYLLSSAASTRINSAIGVIVKAEIIKLQTEIKEAVGV